MTIKNTNHPVNQPSTVKSTGYSTQQIPQSNRAEETPKFQSVLANSFARTAPSLVDAANLNTPTDSTRVSKERNKVSERRDQRDSSNHIEETDAADAAKSASNASNANSANAVADGNSANNTSASDQTQQRLQNEQEQDQARAEYDTQPDSRHATEQNTFNAVAQLFAQRSQGASAAMDTRALNSASTANSGRGLNATGLNAQLTAAGKTAGLVGALGTSAGIFGFSGLGAGGPGLSARSAGGSEASEAGVDLLGLDALGLGADLGVSALGGRALSDLAIQDALAVANGGSSGLASGSSAVNSPYASVASSVNQYTMHSQLGSSDWSHEIGQKLVWMMNGADQSATLTLNPPELGPLRVVIQMNNNTANATFISDNAEVRQALMDGVQNLRDMLGQSGVELGQASVDSGYQGSSHKELDAVAAAGNTSTAPAQAVETSGSGAQPGKPRSGNGLVDTFA